MVVFRPTVFSRISTLLGAIIAALFVGGVLTWFQQGIDVNGQTVRLNTPAWVGPAVGAAILLIGLYLAFFSSRDRCEIEERTFRQVHKGECKFQADDISRYGGSYSQRTRNNSVINQNLSLTSLDTGQTTVIGCEFLSARQFNKLWVLLQQRGLQTSIPTLTPQPPKGS